MDTVTRRQLLKASGVGGGLALAAGAGIVTWSDLSSRAAHDPLVPGTKVLVLLTMYGGNDGLGTVIPYTDPAYARARPDLAYSGSEVLDLDGSLGLNRSMEGLHSLWQEKQLAIVRGVGYPQPDHSHFRSMDIWQTASPTGPVDTGWIGRWLDTQGGDPLKAVSIGSVLPPLAVGASSTAAALPVGRSVPLASALVDAMHALGLVEATDTSSKGLVRTSYRATQVVSHMFNPVLEQASQGSGLAEQLNLVARSIKAGVPTRVYAVSLGGFDTHADEKGTQSSLLGQVDAAVSSFLSEMAADARGRGVVLLAYSEFGRRVMANASDGTDHGTAGPVLVAGVPVKGGMYGDQPSLTDLDDGDLKVTTDFRDVYAEVLSGVLGSDPAQVLDRSSAPVGFLA